jgi:hypothetical protein
VEQPDEIEEDEPDTMKRLVVVDREEWLLFQQMWGHGNVSARIRELVREDISSE